MGNFAFSAWSLAGKSYLPTRRYSPCFPLVPSRTSPWCPFSVAVICSVWKCMISVMIAAAIVNSGHSLSSSFIPVSSLLSCTYVFIVSAKSPCQFYERGVAVKPRTYPNDFLVKH
ncbi:hypothetical protein BKA65DRAFT_494554 [Rhexocercosporidium sp. MPI-PUGE-AT-0058]|nr:hypothetical protein BKA65DRAFT_494554 [Rhexocercosporidium sp. MPI-PUGE-AT-0058]